ncbi:MAG: hypothetical protein SF182_20040 [Deltaproteobacteria bacterium]|nr:hypothetical protein [Deltaproteobacteria bacterium]
MRWSASALIGLALLATSGASAQETVDWRDAGTCVGRVCTLRGTVNAVKDDGPVIRLYFDPDQRDVYLTLMRGWFVTWPDYGGHLIAATGPVDRFRDHVEMIVRDPDAIAVLDGPLDPMPVDTATAVPATATPTVAPTAIPSAVPTAVPTAIPPTVVPPTVSNEVEQLRDRVRELEQRLQELEQR